MDGIEPQNHTGYAQVLEETTTVTTTTRTPPTSTATRRTYTLGHDVLAQQDSSIESGTTLTLVYDGRGNTRALVGSNGVVRQRYAYDAFGNLLGGSGWTSTNSAALTTMLYSGEQVDRATGLQCLRDRYYDPRSARFTQSDRYQGSLGDPVTLHKYMYGNADPVILTDPSGMFGATTIFEWKRRLGALGAVGAVR